VCAERGARATPGAASTTSLQASFLAAQAPATAFGLLRSVERAPVAAVVSAAAVVAAAAVEVAAAWVAATVVPVRRRAAEIAPLTRGPRPIFRDIEAQFTSTDLASVELLDCLGCVLFGCEPNECEASGAARLAVLGNVNVNDLADFSEELT
jgi:hypothetical protein